MKNIFKRVSKKTLVIVATIVATFTAGALVQAWGPERPTYTIESPAPHVTFNSITNNPNYGDERTFFDVKNAANTNSGGFVDNMQVSDGQELLLRVYVHNNAADNLNTVPDGEGGFVGIAEDTKVRIHLPTATDNALRANAYISASNATPVEVNDTVDFNGGNKFGLEYVPGSAIIYTNAVPNGMKLNDSIVTNGATIGNDQLNGKVPGCFKYASIVTIKVKVKKPSIEIQKTVRKAGTTEWKEEVTVNKGDTVEYQLRVANVGATNLTHVVVGDNLPPFVSYVANSTKLKDGNFPNGTSVTSNNITTGGVDIGTMVPGGVSYLLFQAKVANSFSEGCGVLTLKNVGVTKSDQTGNVEDTAFVKVDSGKPCVGPTFVCESLTVEKLGGRKVRATVKAPASGATLKTVTFNYGDGSTPKVTTNLVDEYEYKADGTFKITATVTFAVNGVDKTVTSDACAKTVTFGPEQLPKTGAGSLIGLFAATTIAGAAAHNVISRRRAIR